ncbi:hypothetical protein AZE42_09747 [Rhizopogon vesiculosus]|uniref:Uncharacterized protein n=1 Tax=Rhizopogon vesiculosus TaxID=180088 RepID=A0A1J8QGV6_9AGAM|nr:hypothetical protein AZE42_09747 [Rhizopogon vesiculosus]
MSSILPADCYFPPCSWPSY